MDDTGRQTWDQKAAFWDTLNGDEGSPLTRALIWPAIERLARLEPGQRVLDIACGNGVLARRLAALGGHVTAVDISPALIERARDHAQPSGQPIDYRVVDATDETALTALGEAQYSLVVCSMALMDIPFIAPLFRAVRRLLSPEGRFVFVVPHPAFNSHNPVLMAKRAEVDGRMVISRAVELTAYLDEARFAVELGADDPVPHVYYHRPLHRLLSEAFAAGLVMDALEEPAYRAEDADPARPLAWANFRQFPPILAARLRRPPKHDAAGHY